MVISSPKPRPDKSSPLVQFLKMNFSNVITKAEEGGHMAFNPETGTHSSRRNLREAMANLREATDVDLEVFPIKLQAPAALICFEWSHTQAAGC